MTIYFFKIHVSKWLGELDIRYSENVAFMGRSGYPRIFDFLIPKSSEKPARIIKVIDNIYDSRNSVDATILPWVDTMDTRPPNCKGYAFINDNGYESSSFKNDIIKALDNYGIKPVLWEMRDKGSWLREELLEF